MNMLKNDRLFPYLKGAMFLDGPVTMTIRGVVLESIHNGNSTSEEYVVLLDETEKKFILSAQINALRLIVAFGKESDDWKGKKIIFSTKSVEAFGETHNAIRVMAMTESE